MGRMLRAEHQFAIIASDASRRLSRDTMSRKTGAYGFILYEMPAVSKHDILFDSAAAGLFAGRRASLSPPRDIAATARRLSARDAGPSFSSISRPDFEITELLASRSVIFHAIINKEIGIRISMLMRRRSPDGLVILIYEMSAIDAYIRAEGRLHARRYFMRPAH